MSIAHISKLHDYDRVDLKRRSLYIHDFYSTHPCSWAASFVPSKLHRNLFNPRKRSRAFQSTYSSQSYI